MTRLYECPNHRQRMGIALILLVGLILLGSWYLVFQALAAPSGTDGLGAWALSVAFLLAGVVGLYRVLMTARDWVIALDADRETGRASIWLWSPFGARPIRTELHRLRNWRYVRTGRRGRARFRRILADLDGRSRPLIFDLRLTHPVPDGLRQLAPGPVADYERDIGLV